MAGKRLIESETGRGNPFGKVVVELFTDDCQNYVRYIFSFRRDALRCFYNLTMNFVEALEAQEKPRQKGG